MNRNWIIKLLKYLIISIKRWYLFTILYTIRINLKRRYVLSGDLFGVSCVTDMIFCLALLRRQKSSNRHRLNTKRTQTCRWGLIDINPRVFVIRDVQSLTFHNDNMLAYGITPVVALPSIIINLGIQFEFSFLSWKWISTLFAIWIISRTMVVFMEHDSAHTWFNVKAIHPDISIY